MCLECLRDGETVLEGWLEWRQPGGGLGKEVSEVVGADRGCVEDRVQNRERIPK